MGKECECGTLTSDLVREVVESMSWPEGLAGELEGLQRYRPGVQRTGLATSGDAHSNSRGSRRGAQIIFPSFLKKTKINAFDANMPKCRKRIQKERWF